MDEIEELENKLKEIQEELAGLRKEKKENKRWRAELNNSYFCVLDTIEASEGAEDNHIVDNMRYKYHNYFKTKEEAQAVADNIKTHIELMELAKELNTEPIDWNNDNQEKYYLGFDFMPCGGIYQYFTCHYKNAYTVYCTNENFIKEAIKRIDEERLEKYLKGE